MVDYLRRALPTHSVFLADAVRDIADHRQRNTGSRNAPLLAKSARWMQPADLMASTFYDAAASPASVLIGYDQDQPVYFAGHESVITIGGPGSGKSQAQVIPNLLHYRGSAIVLDIKGELWEATAGYRQKHFGPVLRFAPTDAAANTHRYNPFDFISTDPVEAANDCSIFSYQVIANNPNLKEPYWENKGRDYLWAFAMMIALKGKGPDRTVQALGELMSVPLVKDVDADIHRVLGSMKRLAARTGIADLDAAANAMTAGINSKDRLEAVVDTARRYLSIFNRSPKVAAAMATSDWRPEHFRTRPGTTLYICLSPSELTAYAPVVRAMLMQHVRLLQGHRAKPGERPITFFLDEMPQLGNFDSILELQDVGRGAGLRLWMFAQSLGQLSKAFGADRFEGVVDGCRVRCFLQPDNQAAKLIEPNLGRTKRLLQDKDEPLATASDLMGRAYRDKIIVTTRGDHPMALDKKYAWQVDAARFLSPPLMKRGP